MGNDITHTTFPFSFQFVDPGHSPRLQSPTTLYPHVALILDYVQKRVQGRSTRWSNRVLKLTDYHISRHVASTFKILTKCATHRDLSHFRLFQRGITSTQPRTWSLYFDGIQRHSTPIISREAGNQSTFIVHS